MPPETGSIDMRSVEAFLFHEAKLLDERRWRDWSELFTDDGDYWMPVTEGQPDPINYVSLMYENKMTMELRNRRFEHDNVFSQQPPSRTVHLISNVMIEKADSTKGVIEVRSCFTVYESRKDRQKVFAGTNWHSLTRSADTLKIMRKKVLLVNCDSPMADILVYL